MVYHITFEGLNHWHHKMFEKFGWMILAKREVQHNHDAKSRKHMREKLKCYVNSVERLCHALEEKLQTIEETDRRNDLEVLLMNAKTLYEFASKTLDLKK